MLAPGSQDLGTELDEVNGVSLLDNRRHWFQSASSGLGTFFLG